ncbi:MAG: hypothetical protein ACXU95_09195 [Isosphaeraceae bacterium]
MTGSKTSKLFSCSVLFLFSWLLCMAATTRGDTITLKNGMVYLSQGAPDKDGTLVYIWDGLKKTREFRGHHIYFFEVSYGVPGTKAIVQQ